MTDGPAAVEESDGLVEVDRLVGSAPHLLPLLDEDDLAVLPPTIYLLEGWLPRCGNSEWFGGWGTGKTFAAIDLSLSIAARLADWHGVPIHVHGPVLYIYVEGAAAMKERWLAWREAHPAVKGKLPIRFIPASVNLFRGEDKKLIATLEAEWPDTRPVLVVVDTLRRNSAGADENSAGDLYTIVATLDRIREWSCGATLTLAHPGLNDARPRGTSANEDAFDSVAQIKRDDSDAIVVAATKNKDGPLAPDLRFRLVPFGRSCVLNPEGAEAETAPKELTRSQKTALETLESIALSDGASYSVWEKATGLPARTFAAACKQLVIRGDVTKVSRGKYVVSPDAHARLVQRCSEGADGTATAPALRLVQRGAGGLIKTPALHHSGLDLHEPECPF